MVRSFAILFYLVFAVASGEPEPNVNVKINVNVNGESEESQESGVSCNLVWGSKDYRPLIMIRETKTIVPPVDSAISKDPNRIPIGIKLVIACPGQDNIFNNFVGNQTKLHGECVAENQFKVCFNNSPVYLDLSTLSCSKKLFPSFIKQDNGTSDGNGCDELGGQLYRQGYTYGDYHEFKDLEIEVCLREQNPSSLCTSPNLHGNETDYRIEDPTRSGIQTGNLPLGCGKSSSSSFIDDCPQSDKCTAKGQSISGDDSVHGECQLKTSQCPSNDISHVCDPIGDCRCCVPEAVCIATPAGIVWATQFLVTARVSEDNINCVPVKDRGECYKSKARHGYCNDKRCACCVPWNTCPDLQGWFMHNHICDDCDDDDPQNTGEEKALDFTKRRRGNPPSPQANGDPVAENDVFYKPDDVNLLYKLVKHTNLQGIVEDACKMESFLTTYKCTIYNVGRNDPNYRKWEECLQQPTPCKGLSALDNGHYFYEVRDCQ